MYKYKCPKCGNNNIEPVGNTHFICKDDKTQFKVVEDKKKIFPLNIIFNKRDINEFYKIKYVKTSQ